LLSLSLHQHLPAILSCPTRRSSDLVSSCNKDIVAWYYVHLVLLSEYLLFPICKPNTCTLSRRTNSIIFDWFFCFEPFSFFDGMCFVEHRPHRQKPLLLPYSSNTIPQTASSSYGLHLLIVCRFSTGRTFWRVGTFSIASILSC